jgi:hypothetical protein
MVMMLPGFLESNINYKIFMISGIRKHILFLLVVLIIPVCLQAQEGVRNPVKKDISGKIMVVPFEPQMYMGDIGEKIYIESKWNFRQLSEYFRHQLDNQLKLKLQNIASPVVTFYIDSAKTANDLEYIYKSTSLSFEPIDKPITAKTENKKQNGVKNGQLAVEISSDKKFTNTRLSTTDLIPFLNKKYKSQYFVFINELDMKTVMDSYDLATDSYQREVTVHYTIVNDMSKLITADAASYRFSSKVNDPKKIVNQTFSPIAAYITAKFDAVINPKEVKQP